jgi:phosphatidate cytidylyltransferase
VAAALIAFGCFALGTVATLVLAIVVITLAAAEAFAALRRAGRHPAVPVGLVGVAGLLVAAYLKGPVALPLVAALVVVTALLWYLAGADPGSPVEGITATIFGFAWVGVLGSFGALLLAPSQFPQRHGIAFVIGAVVAVVGNDIGALAVGRLIGRHPMAPRISPNKTWEGFVGGAVVGIVLSALLTGSVHPWTPATAAVLGAVVAVLGPLGDLSESMIKRDLGLKDIGSLLPGHGGVLDRFDALLFVLPATYYLVRVLHLG